jgi:hypothetical protein
MIYLCHKAKARLGWSYWGVVRESDWLETKYKRIVLLPIFGRVQYEGTWI